MHIIEIAAALLVALSAWFSGVGIVTTETKTYRYSASKKSRATLVGLGQVELPLRQDASFGVLKQNCKRARFVLRTSNAVQCNVRIKIFMSNMFHLQEGILYQRRFALAKS